MASTSLIQGILFNSKYNPTNIKKHKKQIKKDKYREGFTVTEGMDGGLGIGDILIPGTDNQNDITNLKAQLDSLSQQLEQAEANITATTTGDFNRGNPTNPYLNKTVRFTTGHIAYVTNQGVVKYIGTMDIWNSTTAPKEYTQLDIPWNDAWDNVPGITIPTTPPLVSGTFMTLGQSLGNEGTNVFVKDLMDNPTATYQGCYANNSKTFIGGSPPPVETNVITNGNFSQSQIANNSYKYLGWDANTVPGWIFNCVLVNNSTAWGYPMPYPNGNQCACIQTTQQLWCNNWMNLSPGVTYTISFDACGRNCCDGSGQANPINVGLEGNTFYSFNPSVKKWTHYSTTFTVDSQGGKRLSFIGTWTASDRSTAIQNVSINEGSNSNGTYTYDMCKQAAINTGYQFFGLVDVNITKKTGYCAVSNDAVGVIQKGNSTIPTKLTAIWSSGTQGAGYYAQINESGSLVVLNSSGANVFSTTPNPNPATEDVNYLGCYQDHGSRAMPNYLNPGVNTTKLDECKQLAVDNKYSYYGFQYVHSDHGECWATNDLASATKYGTATNCAAIDGDGRIGGRGWSNAVYSLTPHNKYYLIIGEDGVMAIYLGTGPSDSQANIWFSDTRGKQLDVNPQKTAATSKYGVNFMTNQDQILYSGDYIASNSGNAYLIMQADGNLVLYATTMGSNCSVIDSTKNIYGGGVGANALYDLGQIAIPTNLGKYGYIDEGSHVLQYPQSMMTITYSSVYTNQISKNVAVAPGHWWTVGSISDAQTACTNEPNCNQFVVLDNTAAIYKEYPNMYILTTGSNIESDMFTGWSLHTYFKKNGPSPPESCNKNIVNIDTIQWQNYTAGSTMSPTTQCSVALSTHPDTLIVDNLRAQINEVSQKILDQSAVLENKNNINNASIIAGNTDISTNVDEYKQNMKKILSYDKQMSGTVEGYENAFLTNIVSDSSIYSNQGNISYIVWSIIATWMIIITLTYIFDINPGIYVLLLIATLLILINLLFREYAILLNILIILVYINITKS